MKCATAALVPGAGCTLVDDAITRPGLIYAKNIHNIAWSADGARLAGSDAPRSFLATWNAQTGASLWRHDLQTATGSGPVAFVDRSTLILSADPLGVLSPGLFLPVLDSSSGRLQGDLGQITSGRLPNAAATCLTASNDGRLVVLAQSKQDYVHVVEFGDIVEVTSLGPIVDGLDRTGSTISFLCLSPDNALLAIGFIWGEAQVWDIRKNTCLSRLAVYGDMPLTGLSFSDRKTLISGSNGIRSLPTHQIIKLPGYKWAPAEEDDARTAVRVWDAVAGEFVRSLPMQDSSGTNSVAATPFGSRAACLSRAKRLHVWRVADGALIQNRQLPFVSELDPDGDVRFSPDGSRIAAAASSSIFVEHLA